MIPVPVSGDSVLPSTGHRGPSSLGSKRAVRRASGGAARDPEITAGKSTAVGGWGGQQFDFSAWGPDPQADDSAASRATSLPVPRGREEAVPGEAERPRARWAWCSGACSRRSTAQPCLPLSPSELRVHAIRELAGRPGAPLLFPGSLPRPPLPPKRQNRNRGQSSLGAPGVSVSRAVCCKQHETERGSCAG